MNRLHTILVPFEVVVEGATGLALIVAPGFVARLLLGAEFPEIGAVVARVAGITLVALVLGAWLGRRRGAGFSGLAALLAYNALVGIYLAWLGFEGVFVGPLLWPAVILHAVVTALIAIAWRQGEPGDLPSSRPAG
jgi:hypothetical protein